MYTEFTVRSGGSNLNAGTLDGAAEAATSPAYNSAGGNWDGTSVFTPTDGTNPVTAGVAVGQFASVYVTSGATVATYVARVTAVTNSANGTVTLSTTAKGGTAPSSGSGTLTLRVGGAWAGPNGAVGFPFGFVQSTMTDATADPPRINFKSGSTYSITAAMTNANSGPATFQGYTTAFGDLGRFVVDGGTTGASYILLSISAVAVDLVDFEFRNNGATGSASGISVSNTRGRYARGVVHDLRGTGISTGNTSQIIECEAYNCNQSNTANLGGFNITSGSVAVRCIAHDNSGANNSGFIFGNGGGSLIDCIAETNGQYGVNGTSLNSGSLIQNLTAYNNASDGVRVGNASASVRVENSVFDNNGGYGINVSTAGSPLHAASNAYRSNTSGQTNGLVDSSGAVTLAGIPFVDAPNGDFRLNSTSGAGAACRGAGRGVYTETAASYAGTIGYPDVGAVQHQDAGGTSGTPAFASVG